MDRNHCYYNNDYNRSFILKSKEIFKEKIHYDEVAVMREENVIKTLCNETKKIIIIFSKRK